MLLLMMLLPLLFAEGAARAENTRVTDPSALSVEVGGRGLLFGLGFDRVLNDDLAAGIAVGYTALKDAAGNDAGVSAWLVPLYFNVYFAREAGSLYATGGATLIASGNHVENLTATYSGVDLASSPLLGNAGLGYEYRSDAGYLFRATGYALIGKKIAPWAGFTLGYSY